MSTETNKKKADKSDKIALYIQRTLCYIVLILLSILCLFSFYVLLINTTRSHPDIQKAINKTSAYSLLDNPTGIYVAQGQELVVLVADAHNEDMGICIQNLSLIHI